MEQIETQATDLRYLTQATAPPAASASSSGSSVRPHPHPHPHSHPHALPGVARFSGDDRRHAAMSPRQLSSSSASSARPPPPLMHALAGAGSTPAGDNSAPASTPLPSPFSPDAPHSGHYAHTNSGSNNGNSNSNASPASHHGSSTPNAKRKPDDDDAGSKQQRSKRNRYISIACNECKRRKIKCNGETPCQRCGNLNLNCLYSPNCCSNSFKDSDEYKHMTDKMQHLEEQVEALVQNVNVLRHETQRLAPLQDRILPPMPSSTVSPSPSSSIPSLHKPELAPIRQPPAFRGGPTSIAFTVDVAKNTLHNMGYSGEPQEDAGGPVADMALRTSPLLPPAGPPSSQQSSLSRQVPSDPLWEFDRNEMVRLCRIHEDEVGIMYPVVKIETVIEHAQSLSSWMESARKSGYLPPLNYDEAMADIRTLTLKIIMCCGLAVEEHGHSDKAIRLYDSIQPIIDGKLMSEPSDLANLPFLALVAGYRFLSNDEVLAWRVMGQVARHCLEQGLHRREGIAKIADEQERRNAINTFWTAYVLDRRWSFGTGLPYVLHDDKIDPNLPSPDEYPYLVAMITYSRLGAKIWSLVDFFEPAIIRDLKREEFEELDREILQWYDTVPEAVRISNLDRELPLPSTPSYNLQRLQIWTRLRLNQIRIWLHTPVLHSASSINDNMAQAQRVVDLAKETIRYLSRLNDSSNLYRRIQVFYHQFLTSAIAVLFLASTHQPVQFSADCREEFYMAMNLVKDMSAKSWVSQRLWRTIRSLKAYAPRLGLQQQEEDQHYSAAAGMSGFNVVGRGGGYSSTSPSSGIGGPARSISSDTWPPQAPQPPPPPPPPYYGRPPLNSNHNSNHSNSAMPSPAGHQQYAEAAGSAPATANGTGTATSSPEQTVNGLQIQSQMTRIFEGYIGMSGIPLAPAGTVEDRRYLHADSSGQGGQGGQSGPGGPPPPRSNGEPAANSGMPHGETVYEHLKNMF